MTYKVQLRPNGDVNIKITFTTKLATVKQGS